MRPQSNYHSIYKTPLYSPSLSPTSMTLNHDYSYSNKYSTLINRYHSKANREIQELRTINYSNLTTPNWQRLKDQIFSPGDEENLSSTIPKQVNIARHYQRNYTPNAIRRTYLPHETSNGKKTLILDLDETLVHSAFKPFYFSADMTLNVKVDGFNHLVHVLKRPYVDEFLNRMSKHYEIVVFTASISQYANPLLDRLDTNHVITYRLFREHCETDRGLYIKDLRRLGRDLKDMIIVDNNPISYAVNQENGIPILTWHFDKGDCELLKLIPILEFLAYVSDVRKYIKQFVVGNSVDFANANRIINNNKNEGFNEQEREGERERENNNYINKEMNEGLSPYTYHVPLRKLSDTNVNNANRNSDSNVSFYNSNKRENENNNIRNNSKVEIRNKILNDNKSENQFHYRANRSFSNFLISSPLRYKDYPESKSGINDYERKEQFTLTGTSFHMPSSRSQLSFTPKLNYRSLSNLSKRNINSPSASYTGTYLNRRQKMNDNINSSRYTRSSPNLNINIINKNYSNGTIDNENSKYNEIPNNATPIKNDYLTNNDKEFQRPVANNYIKSENEEISSSSFRPYSSRSSYSNYRNNLSQKQNASDYNRLYSNQLRREFYNNDNMRNEKYEGNSINNIKPVNRGQNNIRTIEHSPLYQNPLNTTVLDDNINNIQRNEYQWQYKTNDYKNINNNMNQPQQSLNSINPEIQNQQKFAANLNSNMIQPNQIEQEQEELRKMNINLNNLYDTTNSFVETGPYSLMSSEYPHSASNMQYQYRRENDNSNVNRSIVYNTPTRRFGNLNEDSDIYNNRLIERESEHHRVLEYSPNRSSFFDSNEGYQQNREENISFRGRANEPLNENNPMIYNYHTRRPYSIEEEREYENYHRHYSPLRERENYRVNYYEANDDEYY